MAAKSGRNLGDIFSSTTGGRTVGKTAALEKEVNQRAAAVDADEVIKTTTFFTQDQLDYLDGQTREIRRFNKTTIKRTTILRAMVQAFMESKVNIGRNASEAELVMAFRAFFETGSRVSMGSSDEIILQALPAHMKKK